MQDPGAMTEQITLQAPVQGKGTGGGPTTSWVDLRTNVWARKLSERAVEVFAANTTLAKAEVGFAIRWWPDSPLDARHRFLYGGRIFNIVSVVESERRTEIVVLGVAGANRG